MSRKLALLIGTDQYADAKLSNLAVPEKDVRFLGKDPGSGLSSIDPGNL